jgi:hypothetical protein
MSDDDLFTDAPAPAGGDLFTDEPAPTPKSLGGFGRNVVEDVKGNVKGLGDLAEGLTQHPVDTVKRIPGALINEGKRIGLGELLTGHPINAAGKLVDAAYNKPLSTFLDVAPAIGAAGKALGIGGAAAEGADAAATAARAAKVAEEAAPAAEAAETVSEAAPKDLPVVQPGLKTGDPHALFSYNDNFGPNGQPRSIYTVFGDPAHPAFQKHGWGSSLPQEDLGEIPVTGREPRSVGKFEPLATPPPEAPPAGESSKGPPPAKDPLQDVKDYIARSQAKIEAKPGWQEKAAKYMKNEVADLRAKDIGMRDPMIRSLDPKRPLQALKKAEDLMSYAGEQGYFKPGLTNVARKDAIASKIGETGRNIGAIREIGGNRAAPPIADIRDAIKSELTTEYGQKAGREIKTVLSDFDRKVKADSSFQGLSDVATYLNGEKHTFNKIGQNPGPTTDAANIISRMNNEALRKVLSPEENAFYTKNLRDFGAHKKLEQMVASAARRGMTGRGAPGGALSTLWQQLWDRGGYRMAGNVADKMSTSVLKNPGKLKTIPDFFEELAHHTGEEIGDTIEGMYQGGRVPDDVRQYVSKPC